MTTTYTTALRLNKPDFRDPGWGNQVNDNMDMLDTISQALFAEQGFIAWANNTIFTVGRIAIDTAVVPASYWVCNVNHTSALTPTTFAVDRAANPTYWSAFIFSYRARGAWTHSTQYLINDIAYDSSLGITAICKIAHISNAAGTIQDDVANWDYIVNLPTTLPGTAISYSNATSGLVATNVQAAIDEVDADLDVAQASIVTLQGQMTTATSVNGTQTTDIATLQAERVKDRPEVGDVIFSMRSTSKSAWLVANDGTIGNAGSGATMHAASNAVTLFTLLWTTYSDAICPVSSGRGASAAADFAALKTIQITRMLGRILIAAGTGSGLTTRNAGVVGGTETHPLTTAELATHLHVNTFNDTTHDHPESTVQVNPNQTGGGTFPAGTSTIGATTGTSSTGASMTNANAGSGTAHNNMQPFQALYAHIRVVAGV